MADFVKAYCSRSKKYYGLMIENSKVVDFYDIETNKAKSLGSTVDIPSVQSAPNLRPCFKCGSRSIAFCNCAREINECVPDAGYRFQCLYCSDLRLFSKDEGAEEVKEDMIGQTVKLAQGQEVVISAVGSKGLEQILVGVGWDVSLSSENMDVDSSVVIIDQAKKQSELVYYGHLKSASGCVVHRGDNLYGGKGVNTVGNDSENIDVFLRMVPDSVDQLWFVLNIYNCDSRHQTLDDVRNMYIRLTDAKTKKVLVEYNMDKSMAGKTAIIIGKAYRVENSWRFKALGEGITVSNVQSIVAFCKD